MKGRSQAYPKLAHLQVGDEVPHDLYVMDYAAGGRPRWTVVHREEGGDMRTVHLVLEDPDNGTGDLFDDGTRLQLSVITWPEKTLRSQPYPSGTEPTGMLCDMDQQGRAFARGAATVEVTEDVEVAA